MAKNKPHSHPTTGMAALPSKHGAYYRPQECLQRIRNTWGISSYTKEYMIKDLERLRDEQDNKAVRAMLEREIDKIKQIGG